MLPKMNKSFHRLRGRLLFLALAVGIFCTSLLLWGWEKTPLSPSLPHQWRLDSFSLGFFLILDPPVSIPLSLFLSHSLAHSLELKTFFPMQGDKLYACHNSREIPASKKNLIVQSPVPNRRYPPSTIPLLILCRSLRPLALFLKLPTVSQSIPSFSIYSIQHLICES